MAKKEKINLIETFSEFKDLKSINKDDLVNILEESFRSVISKMYGSDENYDIIINTETGDCEILRTRIVVEDNDIKNDNKEIALSAAKKLDEDYEVGEDVVEKVEFLDFGRRAVLTLRQTLASKILEIQKGALYDRYADVLGHIVSGEVYQVWKKEVLLLDEDGNEMLIPKQEQIPNDFFRKGETMRAVVLKVDNKNNNPKIFLSRTSPLFLQRMLEAEVPEIADGIIKIKKVVRIPGERAKVAVTSFDDRIDPVGACVGMKGSRIHGIVRELRGENIDVVNYTENISRYIARALSPAKVQTIELDEENKKANVYLRPEEISLAIGKNGNNIKLATMLTDYTIDVFRNDIEMDEEDIYIDEFSDEIEPWIIDILKSIGCDTAKSVLKLSREELLGRSDLEEETVDEILRVLKAEFEAEDETEKKDGE